MIVKKYFTILCMVLGAPSLFAQRVIMSAGTGASLYVKSGTILGADSLVLTPSTAYTFSNNVLKITSTPVNISPNPSILRVYNFNSQVTFTGTIQIYYQTSELNNNDETTLKYTDSALAGAWVPSATGSVNTTSHYVQQAASAKSFIGATASGQTVYLGLSLMSFTGQWAGQDVRLQWMISQSDENADYDLQRSSDGIVWSQIAIVPGRKGNGLFAYQYVDPAPGTGPFYYRVSWVHANGLREYSNVLRLQQQVDDNLRIFANGRTIYVNGVSGATIDGIVLYSAAGQLLGRDQSSRSRYEMNVLSAGVYFVRYTMNGRNGVKEVYVQ